MNRTPLATAAVVSSSHLQQGLFLMFAVLMTLLAGVAWQRVTQAPEPLLYHQQHAVSSHFSAVSSSGIDMAAERGIEQTAEVNLPAPAQQRWTF